jgi:hypothetical protein
MKTNEASNYVSTSETKAAGVHSQGACLKDQDA